MKLDEKVRKIIAIMTLCLGIGHVVEGVFWGGAETALNKASRICLECIGIG